MSEIDELFQNSIELEERKNTPTTGAVESGSDVGRLRSSLGLGGDPTRAVPVIEPPAPVAPTEAPAATEGGDDERFYPPSRREKRKAWRQTEKERRKAAKKSVRFPIVTRSILLWMLIFAIAGAAFGGSSAYWWAHFNTEVTELRAQTSAATEQLEDAATAIDTKRDEALNEIGASLAPLEQLALESEGVALAGLNAQSVWFVTTLDEEGRPAAGSAFVVSSDGQFSLLVTSYTTIRAATVAPGPEVFINKGTDSIKAEIWNWDETLDLAVLRVQRDLPALEWASEEEAANALGTRVFAVSGLGGAGATSTPGIIVDQSAVGFQHTAAIGTAFQGGPIITAGGKVLGIASIAYSPLGFDGGDVRFAVPIGATCRGVLVCGGGLPAAGEQTKPQENPTGND